MATVGVEPGQANVVIGSTLRLTGTPKNAGGAPVANKTLLWTSENQAVATVSQNGTVTGVSEGTARITASVDGVAGAATIQVTQMPIASITVDPGTRTLGLDGTVQLTATLRDANNLVITGRPVTWSSSAATVASVDGNGLVRGLAPGSAQITATAGGTSGSAQIIVTNAPAVIIAAISPSLMQSGQTATITGTGFGATPAENEVTIAGAPAAVVSASATSLTVAVPEGTCLPAREVQVRVTVGPNQDQRQHPWRPASFLNVPVGQQVRLPAGASHCLQFDESSGPSNFLIGVQSVTGVASAITPVVVRGAGPGSAAGLVGSAIASLPAEGSLHDHDHGGTFQPGSRLATLMARHREAELQLRQQDLETLRTQRAPAGGLLSAQQLAAAAAVPASAAVGDTVDLRYPRTCSQFTPIRTVVRHRGERSIWVEDVANPNDGHGFTAADYQGFSDLFDSTLYPVNVDYFGEPTDHDNNGRIVIVITREVNRTDNVLGRVNSADFPAVGCASGNAGEYFYGIAPDSSGQAGQAIGPGTLRALMPIIIAHELTHVIQFGRRLASGGPVQTLWELEGQATLTEEVVGHAVTGNRPGQNYGFPVIWNDPPLTPIDWYFGMFYDLVLYFGLETASSTVANAPEQCGWLSADHPGPCLGGRAMYGVTWSFLRWLSDHFGPTFPGGEQGLHRAMVTDNRTGFATISGLVGRPIDELLAQWAAMLYVDNRIPEVDPKLHMPSWNFYGPNTSNQPNGGFWSNLIQQAQLRPREAGFGQSWQYNISVRAASTGYFRVSGSNRQPTAISVTGDAGPLPDHMRVWIVRLQ